ncbi:aminotransferase class I/II-fold pyridoxal phosphate-dependent enzyme [Maritimibacter sp. UBA3975]|uniref:DegT/DnrJ/EryC1/StrS family aminotransferase n=1 Tax=Maritimibacter sp. UBA3975 TaxID=1946833 RepID=UPI000C09020F|nr:aminotransferase class I/II-fold pyridoxal phosphate-dependent enzyme [Maritimibacter sp. UBA3975]MAM62288.1 aminotransferase [Maritimibacter sp.]
MARVGLREWLAVGRVIAAGDLLRNSGPLQEVARFERALCDETGATHALAVTSGTSALVCALQAAGIGPGDEVLVPAYTWMATVAAPLLVGAVPVLVEVDETLAMDPDDLAAKITPRSRAVIPVHMLNRPCDMDRIMSVAGAHGLVVIEDSCQAVGVRYKGRACGTIGQAGAFSFNQYKNMTVGEGGAVLTSDPDIHARAFNAHDMGWAYRGAGAPEPRGPMFVGGNYRISEIQGAILRVQLRRLRRSLSRVGKRLAIIRDVLERAGLSVAPHNDPDEVLGLVVTFDTEAEARAFARHRGVHHLFDNSKHIYTEWTPILDGRTFHPGFDPWTWAGRNAPVSAEDCPKTLDRLRRSCRIDPMARLPLFAVRLLARRMTA